MLNVKFNVGQVAKEIISVVVVNPTAEHMTFERTVCEKGNVSYQPALDMGKVYDIWNEYDNPSYLDLSNPDDSRWGTDDDDYA